MGTQSHPSVKRKERPKIMFQMKEQGKHPQKQINEEKIGNIFRL